MIAFPVRHLQSSWNSMVALQMNVEFSWCLLLNECKVLDVLYLWNVKLKISVYIPKNQITDKRTDIWFQPSCIYTQIFSPKKLVFSLFRGQKKSFKFFFYKKGIMQLFSVDAIVFSTQWRYRIGIFSWKRTPKFS